MMECYKFMENLVQIQNRNFTSRSAVLCAKTCMYKRYLQYELEGSGYTTERISLDLLIGTVCHRGLQYLLEHCRLHKADEELSEACIDEAVEKAYEVWRDNLSNHQIWLHTGEEDRLDWIIAEQECLFEGLIRAFAARRLPDLLDEYEILEVEHEEVFEDFSPDIELPIEIFKRIPEKDTFNYRNEPESYAFVYTGGVLNNCPPLYVKERDNWITYGDVILSPEEDRVILVGVTFLGKADGLFRRKRDNKLIILSIKTASQYADVTTRDILHDMQGVSEWVIVQDRLNRYYKVFLENSFLDPEKIAVPVWAINLFRNMVGKPEIFAVQYEYLLKGQRKQDPYGSGIYKQNSFLCHPYQLDAVQQIFIGSKGGTSVVNPAEYKWKVNKGKQPRGWEKIDIWNDIGIKAWIEMLATGQVQPEEGHPFDEILVTPDLVVRDKKEMEEWLVSTRFQEENIARYLELITQYEKAIDLEMQLGREDGIQEAKEVLQEAIWSFFPKNTLSCHNFYGKDCSYVTHCHELHSLEDLKDSGYLIRRESHHELEQKGLESLIEG